MEDMIIKGTGNSRYLKSVANIMTLYPTYESFATALANGTFPIDLNGINPAGVETPGTRLNKASLLTDTLCTALGLSTAATPTQAMEKLRQLVNTAQSTASEKARIVVGSYVGNGTYGSSNPNYINFPFVPKALFMYNSKGTPELTNMYNNAGTPQGGLTEALTTSYQQDVLFDGPSGGNEYHKFGMFARKSSNGRTIYWYASYTLSGNTQDSSSHQMNESGKTYYYLALS